MAVTTVATLDDLYREEGKAELIGGRIVKFMPTGSTPGIVGGNIYAALRAYSRQTQRGTAYPDNVGFTIPELPSGRRSFCPDTAYFSGAKPANPMRFIEGPPTLAVEVRSENDYTPSAEIAINEKRADYFEAGTLVVWDVDPVDQLVRCYRREAPNEAEVFRPGQTANAEPAVPGWTFPVEEAFEE